MSETCDYIIDVCQDHSDDAQDEGCPYCLIERLRAVYEAAEVDVEARTRVDVDERRIAWKNLIDALEAAQEKE